MNKVLSLSMLVVLVAVSAIPLAPVAAETALEEIVVTAQRREQNLMDVPVAVTSYTGEMLEAAGVEDMLDLNLASPSFFGNTLSDPLGNSPVRIRGIGTGGGNPGFEGAVGMYVDGVFRSRAGAAMMTFFDMDNVEILRGPQGTLFGKNTTAGAIVQRSAAPQIGESEAGVSAEAGNYASKGVDAFVNVPVGETAALRLSALWEEDDGFFEHPVDGRDTAWTENTAVRLQLAVDPADRFSARFILDWSEWDSPANYGRSTRIDNRDLNGLNNTLWPSFALNQSTGGEGYWYWTPDPTGANPGPADPFGYEIATTQDADSVLEQWGAVAHLDFELNDNWALRSVTGYRDIDNDNLNGDWDFGPLGLAGRLDQVFRFETWSQEFLLNGSFDFDDGSSLEVVTGLHYFAEDIQYNRIATVGPQFQSLLAFSIFGGVAPLGGGFADGPLLGLPACNGGVPNPSAFCFSLAQVGNTAYEFQNVLWDQEEKSTGLFVHATYDLNDQWSLIAGVRWNRVEKDITADNQAAMTDEQYFDDVVNNSLGFYFADAALASPDWDGSIANEEFTYLATLQFRPTEDTQLYLSYSRGFKAGGFNMTENAAAGEPSLPTARGVDPDGDGRTFAPYAPEGVDFAPEFVDAYELGFRWEYLDAGRLGVTLFRSEYDDLQVSQFTGLVFQVINAGSSTSQGVEIENFYQFNRNFGLNLGLTYLDAEYGSDVVGLPAGRDRGLSPELSAVVGLRYNQQVSNNAELFGNLNYSYYTEMFLAEGVGFPLQGEKQDDYSVLGAELGVRLADGWGISAFCANCFDEEYFTYAFNQPFVSGGSPMGNPGSPQTYGVRLRKSFE